MLDWTDDDPPVDKEKAKLQRLLDDLNKWEPKPKPGPATNPHWQPTSAHNVEKALEAMQEWVKHQHAFLSKPIYLSCEPCRGSGTIRWVNETSTFTWPWAAACPWCRGEGTAREVIERRGVK